MRASPAVGAQAPAQRGGWHRRRCRSWAFCGDCHLTSLLASGNVCPIKMPTTPSQLALVIRAWGGRRAGAGRRPTRERVGVPHRARDRHVARCPAHVMLRAISGLPSLRAEAFPAVRTALSRASRGPFRVLHWSVQRDHLHLLVEADSPTGFVRGVQGLTTRLAKAVNLALGRHGRMWGDRYHARLLRTPREVRNALVYVLNNWRKHCAAARGLDAYSTAGWFRDWRTPPVQPVAPPPVARARTWLGAVGWRRYGPLDVDERPRHGPARLKDTRIH